MASVARRIRRTRVKLEHGYSEHHWRQHGSQHPDAIRHRAAWRRGPFAPPSLPAVVDRLTRVHEQLDELREAV